MNNATVFLIDDDPAVRDAIGLLLSLRGLRTQSFVSAGAFLETYQPTWCGCILSDLCMPVTNGLELQQALRDRGILLPFVVFTAHGDVQTTRLALKGGAFDFLEKPVDDDVLLDVVKNAISQDLRRRDADDLDRSAHSKLERLTPREREVLDLVAQGLSQREIAAKLDISPRTVEVYKARMMEKLQCRTIADIVKSAIAAATFR